MPKSPKEFFLEKYDTEHATTMRVLRAYPQDQLDLKPHPEGGHYRRIHASPIVVEACGRQRPAMTAIEYLLGRGERSAWHRVDADESWHWNDGGALELLQHREGGGAIERVVLGPDPGGRRSWIVPAGLGNGIWKSWIRCTSPAPPQPTGSTATPDMTAHP